MVVADWLLTPACRNLSLYEAFRRRWALQRVGMNNENPESPPFQKGDKHLPLAKGGWEGFESIF